MKTKSLLLASVVALFGAMIVVPSVRADDEPAAKPQHEKKIGPRILKKYDKNGDGVLDEQEKAAWEADKAKHREERKAKKEAGGAPASDKTPDAEPQK